MHQMNGCLTAVVQFYSVLAVLAHDSFLQETQCNSRSPLNKISLTLLNTKSNNFDFMKRILETIEECRYRNTDSYLIDDKIRVTLLTLNRTEQIFKNITEVIVCSKLHNPQTDFQVFVFEWRYPPNGRAFAHITTIQQIDETLVMFNDTDKLGKKLVYTEVWRDSCLGLKRNVVTALHEVCFDCDNFLRNCSHSKNLTEKFMLTDDFRMIPTNLSSSMYSSKLTQHYYSFHQQLEYSNFSSKQVMLGKAVIVYASKFRPLLIGPKEIYLFFDDFSDEIHENSKCVEQFSLLDSDEPRIISVWFELIEKQASFFKISNNGCLTARDDLRQLFEISYLEEVQLGVKVCVKHQDLVVSVCSEHVQLVRVYSKRIIVFYFIGLAVFTLIFLSGYAVLRANLFMSTLVIKVNHPGKLKARRAMK